MKYGHRLLFLQFASAFLFLAMFVFSLSLSPLLNYSKVLFARQDQTTLDKKRFLLFICGLRMLSPLPKPDDVF
jgi:hypothetical protein